MTVDELIDGWEAAWSGKDPSAFAPLCSADVHYEDPLTRTSRSRVLPSSAGTPHGCGPRSRTRGCSGPVRA